MNSTLRQLNSHVGWPVTKAIFSSCATFCFPDRLGDGKPFTYENFSSFHTLEELGIEDWDYQIVNSLVPVDRSLAVWALASTWQMMKLSRWSQDGRLALAQGLRWESEPGGWVFSTIPAGFSAGRQTVLEFIGYDTERYPEFIFVPLQELQNWDKKYLIQWSRKQELWKDPCQLIPRYVERVLAFHNGWIYLTVVSALVPNVTELVEDLAHRWNLPLIEGPPEWSWIF